MSEHDSLQYALTEPVFDALTVEMVEGSDGEALREALDNALLAVDGVPAAGWTIAAVHETVPGAYDLLPPAEAAVSVAQAFDLQYALQQQPGVQTAEALFETTLDNVPESAAPAGDDAQESLGVDWFDELSEVERNPLWSLQLVQVQEVWSQTQGEGVVIGHPDSGYIPHPALDDSRIRHDRERDFYDGDSDAQNRPERGGNHGLSTASVILSGADWTDAAQFVLGVAPKATIIPMRITKKGPPVFLFQSGPRRVRDAIYHAIASGCDVISMSLGGIGERSLQRAIQEAVRANIIVLAAAGNGVPFVVWPARYPETIAVAACDATRRAWNLSSRGPTVDITAPGHNVWRAYYDENEQQSVKPSSGTSYATAVMGGVAALWVAFHGREALREKYRDTGVKLNEVFRRLLAETADPPPLDHNGNFGAGIVNVQRLLAAPLPDPASIAGDIFLESIAEAVEAEAPAGAVNTVAAVFDTVPQEAVEARLTAVTAVPAADLDDTLAGVEEELLFHMVTNPALRETMAFGPAAGAEESLEAEMGAALPEIPGLSQNLRGRLVQS